MQQHKLTAGARALVPVHWHKIVFRSDIPRTKLTLSARVQGPNLVSEDTALCLDLVVSLFLAKLFSENRTRAPNVSY